jgi:ABC-type multidrug transport system permease subunit
MHGAFGAALGKDLRLLRRDRVGLVFLALAPIVVITVSGLSLSALYGGPPGTTGTVLTLADEDGGWAARALERRLAREPAIRLQKVPSRRAARTLVRRKEASAALVVRAGTSAAIAAGEPARLVLYTDPVRSIEVARLRALVQELRHALESSARDRAERELAAARDRAVAARVELEKGRAEIEAQLGRVRAEVDALLSAARQEIAAAGRTLDQRLVRVRAEQARARERLGARLQELRALLVDLAASERAFTAWLAVVRDEAGRFADRVPPPPRAPVVPAELRTLAETSPDDLLAELFPADGAAREAPRVTLPALPELRLPTLPALPETPPAVLPGRLGIRETSVTGAPRRLNTFDQNVPGFSITFLLLGVLLGVSLGFLDEREWGTLDRVRTTPTPLVAIVLAKLVARGAVGLVQMLLLFAVGRIAFSVSLGAEPAALLLPTIGIVLAATTFGLVIAALTRSREAVLPLGSIVILTMAAVGGCWWPIDLEPAWMRRVALAFPTTWAMEAYNDLMIRRRSAAAVLPATGVLLAHAAVYLVAGLALFRRRIARGR